MLERILIIWWWVKDWLDDKPELGGLRSPQWRITKREFAKLHPKKCSINACKAVFFIELHHCIPFHIRPDLENDFSNLRWFCRKHHLEVAHLFNFQSYCPDLDKVINLINEYIKNRPTKEILQKPYKAEIKVDNLGRQRITPTEIHNRP